jgi:hypothetical protein
MQRDGGAHAFMFGELFADVVVAQDVTVQYDDGIVSRRAQPRRHVANGTTRAERVDLGHAFNLHAAARAAIGVRREDLRTERRRKHNVVDACCAQPLELVLDERPAEDR